MSTAKVVETIAATAAQVWDHLSDFGGIQPGGMIESCEVEGEGVGMVRTLTLANGVIKERLDNHDAEQMTFTYSIINEDIPLPVSGYSSTVNITPSEDGESTTVDWTGTFEPKGVEEEKAIQIVKGIYIGAIQGARKALAGDEAQQ